MKTRKKPWPVFGLLYMAMLPSLFAQIPPSIDAPPRSQINWAGNNVILGVSATGTEPLSYQWLFNDEPLVGQTDPLLLLPITTTTDTGSYSVAVTNPWGSVTSAFAALTIRPLHGSGAVVAWGSTGSTGLREVTGIAGGYRHTVALKSDGKVVAWGDNSYGQTDVPADLSEITAIAAGYRHTAVLKRDGTVVAWGDNYHGETDVPPDLSNVVSIASTAYHHLALKNDGTVVAWGYNLSGMSEVPDDLSVVVGVAAGSGHSIALKASGTVVAWGHNSSGQTDVPADLIDVVGIAAGRIHSVALKGDGTVVAWGDNSYDQTDVPLGLSGVTAIAAGRDHTVALKSDGAVVAWGKNDRGQTSIPPDLGGVSAIAAGWSHSAAITTIADLPIRIVVDHVFAPNGSVGSDAPAEIGLYTAFTDAAIYYSTDGTDPYEGGPLTYTGRFTLNETATIRALAVNLDDSTTAVSEPTTVYVRHPLTCTTPGGGSVVTFTSPSDNTVAIEAIPDEGWTFMSWSGDLTGTNPTATVTADRPKSVQATFGTMLGTSTAGGGAILTAPAVGPYPYGSTVHLMGSPDEGNYFVGWDGVVTGNVNPKVHTITSANPPISATFATGASGQVIEFDPLTDRILGDPPFTLNATSSSGLPVGYVVLSGPATIDGDILTIAGGGDVVVRAMQAGNAEYSAANFVDHSFSVYLTLETSTDGFGSVIRDPDLELYPHGTEVQLAAIPKPGFETAFSSWSGSVSSTINPITVLMDGNKEITAHFVSTNTTGIANVFLEGFDFDPANVDVSFAPQTVTVTAHLTSGGAPITRALVLFPEGLELELLPQNLVSGDSYDGIYQGTLTVGDWIRVGTHTLKNIYIGDETGRYKVYSTTAVGTQSPVPPGTPTDLVVTAPDHSPVFGAVSGGADFHDPEGRRLQTPLIVGPDGEYGNPLSRQLWMDNTYFVVRGETRPILCVFTNWVMFGGPSMGVSCNIAAMPDTELQTDIGVRLVRIWTKDYLPGWGEFQRDWLVQPPEGAPCSDYFPVTTFDDGANAPTWSLYAGYLITPPPGGFRESFRLNADSRCYYQDNTGGQITVSIIAVLRSWAKIVVIDKSSLSVAPVNEGQAGDPVVLSWFGTDGLSFQVQWTDDLGNNQWNTVPGTVRGSGAMLNWIDDGTATAPHTEPSRFYRIVLP